MLAGDDPAPPRVDVEGLERALATAERISDERSRLADDVRSLRAALDRVAELDTGLARAQSMFACSPLGEDQPGRPAVRVVRYPLDLSSSVKRFLDSVAPDAVAWMPSTISSQCLTGVSLTASRCSMQPMFALAMTSGPPLCR